MPLPAELEAIIADLRADTTAAIDAAETAIGLIGAPATVVVSAVEVQDIAQTSVKVRWLVTPDADGYVDYGPTVAYGETTTGEAGLLAEHIQTISGLAAGMTYYFRIRSTAAGIVGSYSGTFQTAAAASPVAYGPGVQMDTKSNIIIGPSSRRLAYDFIAPASGTLDAVRWQLRTGTNYHAGTGGTIRWHVETCDDSGPTGTTVGSAATQTVFIANNGILRRTAFVSTKPVVVAGQRYAVIISNSHATPEANWFSINCNMVWSEGNPQPSPYGLFPLDATHKVWTKTTGAWGLDPRHWIGIAVEYAGASTFVGSPYHNTMLYSRANQVFGGTTMLRQSFTPSQTKTVNKLWARVGRVSGVGDLTISLHRLSDNALLRSLSFPSSSVLALSSASPGPWYDGWHNLGNWLGGALSSPLQADAGTGYYVRLAGASGVSFSSIGVHFLEDGTVSNDTFHTNLPVTSPSIADFGQYNYQRSTNGGFAWSAIYQWTPGQMSTLMEVVA